MKQITKRTPPESFDRWCGRHPQKDWELFCQPENSDVRNELFNQLRLEQGNICCYCEKQLNSGNAHIEHLKPKSLYKQDEFNYNNLLASCKGRVANPALDTCGHKKLGWYSQNMITPLADDCENRFIYDGNGQILPRDNSDTAAIETRSALGLDNKKLCGMRKAIYIEIEAYRSALEPHEFETYVEQLLRLDSDRNYSKFWTTIKYVSENN